VAGDDRRTGLEREHLAEPGDVVREHAQRELRRGDVVTIGLQTLDDGASARPVGPGAVDQHDVR
jgi:hypothetical protein